MLRGSLVTGPRPVAVPSGHEKGFPPGSGGRGVHMSLTSRAAVAGVSLVKNLKDGEKGQNACQNQNYNQKNIWLQVLAHNSPKTQMKQSFFLLIFSSQAELISAHILIFFKLRWRDLFVIYCNYSEYFLK